MFTDISQAPWTGTPMFHMKARVTIPEKVSVSELKDKLSELELKKDLDIIVKPYTADWMEK